MANEGFDKEKERMLQIFEQLPKEKQDELLSSKDLLRSWVKSNVKTTENASHLEKSWSSNAVALGCFFNFDGFTLGPDEYELGGKIIVAIADYIMKKMGGK